MNAASIEFFHVLAAQLDQVATNWMVRLFGPDVNRSFIGSVTWADIGILAGFAIVILVVHFATAMIFHNKRRNAAAAPEEEGKTRVHLFNALGKPLYLLIWICGLYIATAPVLAKYATAEHENPLRALATRAFDIGIFVVVFWACFRFTRVIDAILMSWARRTESKIDDVLVPLAGRALRVLVPVVGVFFALPVIGLPPDYESVVQRGSSILVILAAAWIFSQAVRLGEQAVLARFDITAADNLRARKVYTQVHVLSKTLYVLIAIFTVASILMLFEEVRRFGTSLLASAGVVGVIAGFAAQRTIANLFAGFQLAMTQPIRLDDVVIVENEWGRVEEITLTYVVVRIWDERRLVVPLSYFIEKPFQNWTRVSAELLGSVTVSMDYSIPVEELRKALKQIVEGSPLWDKRFWNLQVTDATERTIQLRVLATSEDSGKGWDLRCEIREKLIAYIQKHHPNSLPQTRWNLLPGGKLEEIPTSSRPAASAN